MDRKQEELQKLLADGYEVNDLTWIPEGSPVAVELVYVQGQDEAEELRKALDKMQSGQWMIKAEAVERRIRAVRGCEKVSLSDWKLPSFLRRTFGSRGAR